MSSRTGWIAGAMVVGALALVVLMRPNAPVDSPAASPLPPEPAALPDEPRRGATVGQETAAPEPPTRELPPLPAQAAAPSEVAEQSPQAARPIPAPPDFAANYAVEPIDAEWAPRAQTDILSRFAEQAGLQLNALQVECRTTMCQVQMTQPNATAGEPPMALLRSLGMQPLSINVVRSQGSMLTLVVYVARPGREPFPMPQRAASRNSNVGE